MCRDSKRYGRVSSWILQRPTGYCLSYTAVVVIFWPSAFVPDVVTVVLMLRWAVRESN
jgi:hypothetical protein